jgi:hypothetical protein
VIAQLKLVANPFSGTITPKKYKSPHQQPTALSVYNKIFKELKMPFHLVMMLNF